jgi:hypothetical protein
MLICIYLQASSPPGICPCPAPAPGTAGPVSASCACDKLLTWQISEEIVGEIMGITCKYHCIYIVYTYIILYKHNIYIHIIYAYILYNYILDIEINQCIYVRIECKHIFVCNTLTNLPHVMNPHARQCWFIMYCKDYIFLAQSWFNSCSLIQLATVYVTNPLSNVELVLQLFHCQANNTENQAISSNNHLVIGVWFVTLAYDHIPLNNPHVLMII